MNFKAEIIFNPLLEALKIVKRGKSQGKDDRELHMAKAHADEISKEEDLFVANVNGILIIKSKHLKDTRKGDSGARDSLMDNTEMVKVFKKLFLKPNFRPGKSQVAFKTKRGYDLMAIGYDARFKTIKIITYIRKHGRSPYDTFSTNREHQKDPKITVENFKELGITPELASDLLENYTEYYLVD